MVVALGAGDPPQLGQAGWDPALPWEGNSSQWECELGRGNTYSSTIRLLFTNSDLARALAPLLLI